MVNLGWLRGSRHILVTVKVIASGTLDKAVTVSGLKVTAGARKIIEAAGGKVLE